MALTMELFTTQGGWGGKWVKVCLCVCVQERALVPLVVKSEWKGMMESLKHAGTERRGERRGGLKEEYWVLPAKVKNHAMVQRGLFLSTGRSDYIYAGTQVLLYTLPFTRSLHALPRASLGPYRPLFYSFPSCPQLQSRYKWLFAVQLPKHVCVSSCLSLTACKTKEENRPFRYS